MGALARTHRNLKKQNPTPTGAGINQASANPPGECTHSPGGSGATVGYCRTGYPERTSKRSLKSHQETKQEGKPWAPHPPRPSPPGPPLCLEPRAGGLGGLTQSPPRARLSTEGLGRGCILRIARGVSREASARSPISISREASFSISCKASFSVSPEAGSSAARHPPPRPTLQTTRHVSLMLQPLPQSQPDDGSTPQNGRRDPRSHQRHAGRDRARRGLPATVS